MDAAKEMGQCCIKINQRDDSHVASYLTSNEFWMRSNKLALPAKSSPWYWSN